MGPKKSRFQEPSTLPLATVMNLPASKALHAGPYQSEVHRFCIKVERNFKFMIKKTTNSTYFPLLIESFISDQISLREFQAPAGKERKKERTKERKIIYFLNKGCSSHEEHPPRQGRYKFCFIVSCVGDHFSFWDRIKKKFEVSQLNP